MRSSNGPSKLFVGDIGNNRKSDLNHLFSKYGEISTIYFDENKRFAFVEFTSPSDAQRALRHTNNKTVNGSRLRVEYAKSDRPPRDNRRPVSRDRSPASALYNHLEVTANRLPSMQAIRQSYYQYHPSPMASNSAVSRGRSLTPPSFKHNARLSSMNHLRTPDFYPPYYPPHSAMYPDSTYYRTYGDPYLMQRLPPPGFLPPISPPPSSSNAAYRNMYSSSGLHRYPQETSHKRTRRSRSRSGRRGSTSRKIRSSRERKRKRRSSSSSSSSSEEPRERGPQTPPSSNKSRKRSRSSTNANASPSEHKSSSSSSSEDENFEDKESNSKKSHDDDSSRKHSKKETRR